MYSTSYWASAKKEHARRGIKAYYFQPIYGNPIEVCRGYKAIKRIKGKSVLKIVWGFGCRFGVEEFFFLGHSPDSAYSSCDHGLCY